MFIQKPVYRDVDYQRISDSYNNIYSKYLNDFFFENLCKNEYASYLIEDFFSKLNINENLHKFSTFLTNPFATHFIIQNIDIFCKYEDLIKSIFLNPNSKIIFNKCDKKLKIYSNYFDINNKKTNDEIDNIFSIILLDIKNNGTSTIFEQLSFSNKNKIIEMLCKLDLTSAINFVENNINYLIGEQCLLNLMENPLHEAVILTEKIINNSSIGKEMMLQHPNYIKALCRNPNINVIRYIEENNIIKNKKCYENDLALNKNALHILFKIDYQKMKTRYKPFCEELCKKVFNPIRINNVCKIYNIEAIDYIDYFI